jgi:drug/metabolite transporter (DMT)-like permease
MPHELDPSPPLPAVVPDARERAPAAARRPRVWIGFAMLLAAAFCFAMHNNLARLLYDEGIAPTTIAATRTWALVVVFAVVFGSRGAWPRVPRAAWPTFIVTAIGYCAQNPLLLIAFEFVPVSLAVLVLYVYPIIVALMAAAIRLERLRITTLAAAAIAFSGVALVLAKGDEALDWRGIAIAATAAVTLSVNIVGAARLNRYMPSLGVPQSLSIVGALAFGALMLVDGGPTLPTTAHAWWLFAAAIALSPAAIIFFYVALPFTGAARSALAMNAEPITTVLLASLLLGEFLAPLQLLGGLLIVAALGFSAVMNLKRRWL